MVEQDALATFTILRREAEMTVQGGVTRHVRMTAVGLLDATGTKYAVGLSIRSRGDKPNPAKGLLVARGRAHRLLVGFRPGSKRTEYFWAFWCPTERVDELHERLTRDAYAASVVVLEELERRFGMPIRSHAGLW